MKLKVLSPYRNRDIKHEQVGEVIEVDEAMAEFLMRDAPGCFEKASSAVEYAKAPVAPPAHKMMVAPVEAKDYTALTVGELRDELRNRDLPAAGNKAELVARLEEDDEA